MEIWKEMWVGVFFWTQCIQYMELTIHSPDFVKWLLSLHKAVATDWKRQEFYTTYPERQSARMSRITNDGFTRSGTL